MEISREYKKYIIRVYNYWTLFLYIKQHPYIGRCYVWWNDREPKEGEGMPYDAIPTEALEEAQAIWRDVVFACEALGYKTLPYGEKFLLNKAYLANEPVHNHHMHEHFIPRSALAFKVPGFCGLPVEPVNWGGNYNDPPVETRALSEETTQQIKQLMAEAIAKEHNTTSPRR